MLGNFGTAITSSAKVLKRSETKRSPIDDIMVFNFPFPNLFTLTARRAKFCGQVIGSSIENEKKTPLRQQFLLIFANSGQIASNTLFFEKYQTQRLWDQNFFLSIKRFFKTIFEQK